MVQLKRYTLEVVGLFEAKQGHFKITSLFGKYYVMSPWSQEKQCLEIPKIL